MNTFWDLGRNDENVIWLHQRITGFHRFVGDDENSRRVDRPILPRLREWARERDVVSGDHYIPHDGDRESLWLEQGTMGVMEVSASFPSSWSARRSRAGPSPRPAPSSRPVSSTRPPAISA